MPYLPRHKSYGHVSYTLLRQNLARCLDQAVDSRVPILVTRQADKGNVVIPSAEEFEGWQETVHLLRSPANAQRLLRSIRSADAGAAEARDLVHDTSPNAAPER